MTITFYGNRLYLLALLVIALGLVRVALIARSLKNGYGGAWQLALGVAISDVTQPVLALLTLGQLGAGQAARLTVLKYVAVSVLVVIGGGLIIAWVDQS